MTQVVASTNSLKNAIIKRLRTIAKNGIFYRTNYDKTGNPIDVNVDVDKPLEPASVICNEIQAGFERDENYGRALAVKRTAWSFELHLSFHKEVSLDLFEFSLMNPVPIVTVPDFPSVALELTDGNYEHPPSQQASSGTSVVYVFNASAGRI